MPPNRFPETEQEVEVYEYIFGPPKFEDLPDDMKSLDWLRNYVTNPNLP